MQKNCDNAAVLPRELAFRIFLHQVASNCLHGILTGDPSNVSHFSGPRWILQINGFVANDMDNLQSTGKIIACNLMFKMNLIIYTEFEYAALPL